MEKTDEHREIARQFGEAFFDGKRDTGYGGFRYHPRFWGPVIPKLQQHFHLDGRSRILDVGCAKGFMLYDFCRLIPGIEVAGIDISEYAIENAIDDIKPFVQVANAIALPYEDNSFDAVFSITTLHNLERDQLAQAIREIERVTKNGRSFITNDAYRDDHEKKRMEAWNLTAKTMMHVEEWRKFYDKVGFNGDYYWFFP